MSREWRRILSGGHPSFAREYCGDGLTFFVRSLIASSKNGGLVP